MTEESDMAGTTIEYLKGGERRAEGKREGTICSIPINRRKKRESHIHRSKE